MFLALMPLVAISVGWFVHDPVGLFASTVLVVGALTGLIFFSGRDLEEKLVSVATSCAGSWVFDLGTD